MQKSGIYQTAYEMKQRFGIDSIIRYFNSSASSGYFRKAAGLAVESHLRLQNKKRQLTAPRGMRRG